MTLDTNEENVKKAILAWDPNEEEVLDEEAVSKLTAYMEANGYKIVDIEKYSEMYLSDDQLYTLYDLLKWTAANAS